MAVAVRVYVDSVPREWDDSSGRHHAFADLYQRFRPDLVRLCRRQLPTSADAEAVAQEAFTRAWASMDRFTGARPFWPWVATIARRICIDELRRGGREQRGQEYLRATVVDDVLRPDEHAIQREDERSALAALRTLPPREQRLITLCDLNEWSYQEIAEFEHVSVESVRGLLKRARASLRRAYQNSSAALGASTPVLAYRRFRDRLTTAASGAVNGRVGEVLAAWHVAEVMATTVTFVIVTSSAAAAAVASMGAVAPSADAIPVPVITSAQATSSSGAAPVAPAAAAVSAVPAAPAPKLAARVSTPSTAPDDAAVASADLGVGTPAEATSLDGLVIARVPQAGILGYDNQTRIRCDASEARAAACGAVEDAPATP